MTAFENGNHLQRHQAGAMSSLLSEHLFLEDQRVFGHRMGMKHIPASRYSIYEDIHQELKIKKLH